MTYPRLMAERSPFWVSQAFIIALVVLTWTSTVAWVQFVAAVALAAWLVADVTVFTMNWRDARRARAAMEKKLAMDMEWWGRW